MKRINLTHRATACGVLLFAGVGCVAESTDQISETRETAQHLDLGGAGLAAGEFAYLRCNATSWGVDDASRLVATDDANITTLTFEVTQPWMLSGSDSCTLTVTNALNGWGNQNSHFGASTPLQIGASSTVTPNGSIPMQYPELGLYTVRVNWASGEIRLMQGDGEEEATELTIEEAAAQNAALFYAYLQDRFSWSGLDNNGTLALIFSPSGPENNAQYVNGMLRIGAADGIVSNSFAYSADMIAHELTHGVIEHTTQIMVGGEHGAINESLADVMAVFSTATNGVVDWRVGEQVWTPANPSDALRNLQDPHIGVHRETRLACTFDPDLPFICGQAKHMNEYANISSSHHLNNGILNRAAYLLVEGGEGVSGIGVSKAEQVYFRALTQHIPKRASFSDLRHALEISCTELTGQFAISSADCSQIGAAMAAVGIPALILDAPVGISGTVTQNGVPAIATVALYAGAVSPPLAPTKMLEVTSDENGFYYFPPEDLAAELALHPPLGFVTRTYKVEYVNPDSSDQSRVAKWETPYFNESPFAPGTFVRPFDIGGVGATTVQGEPTMLPMIFQWNHRTSVPNYYRWRGTLGNSSISEDLYHVHSSPSLFIDETTEFLGGSELIDLEEWNVEISGYDGTGSTNPIPLD